MIFPSTTRSSCTPRSVVSRPVGRAPGSPTVPGSRLGSTRAQAPGRAGLARSDERALDDQLRTPSRRGTIGRMTMPPLENLCPDFSAFWEEGSCLLPAEQKRLWRSLYEDRHRAVFDVY